MVRGTLDGGTFAVSLRDESVTAGLESPDQVGTRRLVAAYDRAGRLYSFWRDGHTFRRGLNGRVLHKWTDVQGRHRAWLAEDAAGGLVDEAASVFSRLARLVRHGDVAAIPDDPAALEDTAAALEAGARFTAEAARADAERFARVYAPIGILPPDQYLAFVVQATVGCSFSSCTYCDLYHDAFRVKSAAEFERHVAEVRAYLGASERLRRRSIFLGAANALAVPMATLLPMLDILARDLDACARGVGAFVDGFTGARKSVGDYRVLAARGLRRVYIGLESGHDPLLAFVRKPGTRAQAVETARAIKEAGVHLGVIVMTGLGGQRFDEGHVTDTIRALNDMGLGEGDLLYFSDLVEMPGTTYPGLVEAAGIQPLGPAGRRTQRDTIRHGLRFPGPPPKMSTYDVREFVY